MRSGAHYKFSKLPRVRSTVLKLLGGVLMLLLLAVSPAQSQSPSPATPAASSAPPLRIATRLLKPDAFQENGQIVGFSADIGRSILEQLQRTADIKTYASVPEILTAIQSGQADLGIAAIALTSQREQDFDFSHPILSSRLGIMVLTQSKPGVWQRLVAILFSANMLDLLGIVALLMLIPVHLVWYFERNNKELISNSSYLPGIFEALWWTVLTLFGQAEEMPKAPVGRVVALFWVLVGIVFVTYFTAIITAELTVQELQGDIQDLSDLQNRRVALVSNSEAAIYLQRYDDIETVEFPQPEQAYEALLAREVDAIVESRPLLLYYAARESKGKVQVVGSAFQDQFYSIAMPRNSPYRRPVNQAILTLKENGTYREIHRKWYGIDPEA